MNLLRSLAAVLAFGSILTPVDGAKERHLRSRSLQTTDGETPAIESVCDDYEGQAYGLCNAFCEAQDCIYSEEIKSCDKIREKWEELVGGRLPCAPTMSPTTSPTMSPTKNPTKSPTKNPTESPTKNPTESPTKNPTESPTKNPTESPTKNPTESPTKDPTESPTKNPTESPTKNPPESPTTNCGGEAPGVISNCLIKLGVNPTGNLIVPGGASTFPVPTKTGGTETDVGLRYIFPTGVPVPESESTSFGAPWEGWGVGVGGGESLFFNRFAGNSLPSTYNLVNFLTTSSTAESTVAFANGKLQITHDYHPSATPNLYEVTVTMVNTGPPIAELLYRRTMDWDIYPTNFNECVTIQPGPVGNFVAASNNGFASSNPYASLISSTRNTPAPFVDNGPTDQGAAFDFSFGALAPGGTKTFNMYLGAGANQAEAEAALALVGAEVYSLAKPSTSGGGGVCADTPNVYVMAFTGVGGPPIFGPPPLFR